MQSETKTRRRYLPFPQPVNMADSVNTCFIIQKRLKLLQYSFFLINLLQMITVFEDNLYTFWQPTKHFFKVVLLKIEHCAAITHPWWVEENKMITLIDNKTFYILCTNSIRLVCLIRFLQATAQKIWVHLFKQSVLKFGTCSYWSSRETKRIYNIL